MKRIVSASIVSAAMVAAVSLAPVTVAAAAPCTVVQSPAGGSYLDCANGQVLNVLPPGSNGLTNAQQFLSGQKPPHSDDQLAMYADLKKFAPNLNPSQLLTFYKPEIFGVAPGDVDHVTTFAAPHDGTVIVWDKSKGVPHVFGRSRADTEFGAGYAAAHDRLFMMDVLRHIGRSRLAEFIGPSAQAIQEDCTIAHVAGYSESELNYQANALAQRYTKPFAPGVDEGQQVFNDGTSYVSGINAYIDAAKTNPNLMPFEYHALQPDQQIPQHWGPADIVAVATIVQSIFAVGGGDEVDSSLLLQALRNTFPSGTTAEDIWKDLRSQNDPEAPTTLQQSFPYMTQSSNSFDLPGNGVPDSTPADHLCTTTPQATGTSAPRNAPSIHLQLPQLVPGRKKLSNALLVDAAHSSAHRPIAVFGPQVSYFDPEILHEEDLHGPGISARGSSFPGTDVYVELGRGVDYAWSATSASSDLIDKHLDPICNPNSPASYEPGAADGTSYWYAGRCQPMYERTDTETALPTGAAPGAAIVTFHIERTVHGPVVGRTTATYLGHQHAPMAVSYQRTTWFDELGAAVAFLNWNDPDKIHGASDFLAAAGGESGTFNWFYLDSRDIAYYSSGRLPQRSANANPSLVSWGDGNYEWQGFAPIGCDVPTPPQPDSTGPRNTSTGATTTECGYNANWLPSDGSASDPHPHAINPPQGWMTNWNNKPAPGWSAADNNFNYGPVYRVQSLSDRVAATLARGPAQPVDIVNAMEDAGAVDLDGSQIIPYIDRIRAGEGTLTPREQHVMDLLNAWWAENYRGSTIGGSLRTSGNHASSDVNPQAPYLQGNAVAIMDKLYPALVHAIFDPWLNSNQFNLTGTLLFQPQPGQAPGMTNAPGPTGSAYDGGWEGFVQRSLRQADNPAIANPYSQSYCAANPGTAADRQTCQRKVDAAFTQAENELTAAYGSSNPDDWTCTRSNDATRGQCNPATDDIQFQALGAQHVPNIEWINRPTFQQVVQFPTSRSEQPVASQPSASPQGGVLGQTSSSQPGLPNTGAPRTRQPAAMEGRVETLLNAAAVALAVLLFVFAIVRARAARARSG